VTITKIRGNNNNNLAKSSFGKKGDKEKDIYQ
jgi:hypothetical protein